MQSVCCREQRAVDAATTRGGGIGCESPECELSSAVLSRFYCSITSRALCSTGTGTWPKELPAELILLTHSASLQLPMSL